MTTYRNQPRKTAAQIIAEDRARAEAKQKATLTTARDKFDAAKKRNWAAQARYDEQWGTTNGYSDLDYRLEERRREH